MAQLSAAKQELAAKASLRTNVIELAATITTGRWATRGFVLTAKPKIEAVRQEAMAAARLDVTYVAAHAALLPGIASELQRLPSLVDGIDAGNSALVALTRTDRDAVIGFYFKGYKTGRYAPAAQAMGQIIAKQAALDPVLAEITDAASSAADAASVAFDATFSRLTFIILNVTLATIAVTAAITVLLSRRMSQRLGRVSNALTQMVTEDFTDLQGALARLAQGDLRASFRSKRAPIRDGGSDEMPMWPFRMTRWSPALRRLATS